MTPRLRHLPALNWILLFEFPNEALSSSVPSVCVDVSVWVFFFFFFFNHHIALSLCNHNIYVHARHPETPLAFRGCDDNGEMHSGLLPHSWDPCCAATSRGNAGKVKGQVWRRENGINCVESTVNTHQSYKDASLISVCFQVFSFRGV